jgi:hypothetical protein
MVMSLCFTTESVVATRLSALMVGYTIMSLMRYWVCANSGVSFTYLNQPDGLQQCCLPEL